MNTTASEEPPLPVGTRILFLAPFIESRLDRTPPPLHFNVHGIQLDEHSVAAEFFRDLADSAGTRERIKNFASRRATSEDTRPHKVFRENGEVGAWKGPNGDLPHVPLVLAERMIPLRRGFQPPALGASAFGRMTLLPEGRAAGRGDRLSDRINVVMVDLLPCEQKHVLVTFRRSIRESAFWFRIWLHQQFWIPHVRTRSATAVRVLMIATWK